MVGWARQTDQYAHHIKTAGGVQPRIYQVGGVIPRLFWRCGLHWRRDLCVPRASSAETRRREIQERGGARRTCRRLTRARPNHATCETGQR